MQRIAVFALIAFVSCTGLASAQSATEKEVTQAILEANKYLRQNLTEQADTYSKLGAMEFWSSGGLLQIISAAGRAEPFEAVSVELKHIQVIPLIEGQAAVAHYYSEGSMKPKGAPAVNHYLTRVTQVFVKEDGKWKIRASHWSPISGGSGTTQTSLEK